MKARVRLTPSAEGDLAEIYHRRLLQRGADGSDGAEALLVTLVAAIEGLADWPSRGPLPVELEAMGTRSHRQLSVPPYRVIYSQEEIDGEIAVVVQIVADARRDFTTLLQERLINRR
ncbi:type II toxin-antitoxin system RelE/ParE family toxin [Sphingomonas crocodyli]|uniref:Type II toxin-antitoxin system RelE/ParE family toxin n=1 Tax=Sphingomonas crocodyli TaxID=1979270 RepID=A0A437LZT3_9SPHN|nr:type II toxin-antitoxin system RelE/ParE family toxin [Sphingomonas crocodyli]RVT90833.1 type II toxin-antitoxin system RelE/ParE family toxin [Sphingomonas crocodyli]